MKKKYYTLIFLIFFFKHTLIESSFSKVEIKVFINDEIITNIDIKKEAEYLKVLNPSLNQINENKISEISKNSLINEIIKKKEISRFVKIESVENEFLEDYFKNLYTRLNYNNEIDFENNLNLKNSYNVNEVRNKLNIELFWNELIYNKYNKLVKIDKELLLDKIEKMKKENQVEYSLSEIVFTKKKDEKLENQLNQILLSIDDIGFKNTANIYSISDSSKFGGELEWINKNSLSKKILKKLSNLKIGEITDLIDLGNSFLILKINDIRTNMIEIDKELEMQKLIKVETNNQLNKFSRIFFNKSKINYSISEK
tara:strand:- start:941 stop:1879 length:939 start_codon:yes stop_codon:yes gene_type:complete